MPTVKELTADLEARGVEIPAGARKADLEALLADAPAPAPTLGGPTVPAGGIDPVLVAARDAARDVEARTRVGRVRPTPAGLDPRLVEIAEQTRQADAASIAPATAPPSR